MQTRYDARNAAALKTLVAGGAKLFPFPKDMMDEYDGVLKAAGARATLRDSFYIVHESNPPSANENSGSTEEYASAERALPPKRLVIEDGDWVGFSHHDARRLKIRYGRFSKRDPD